MRAVCACAYGRIDLGFFCHTAAERPLHIVPGAGLVFDPPPAGLRGRFGIVALVHALAQWPIRENRVCRRAGGFGWHGGK